MIVWAIAVFVVQLAAQEIITMERETPSTRPLMPDVIAASLQAPLGFTPEEELHRDLHNARSLIPAHKSKRAALIDTVYEHRDAKRQGKKHERQNSAAAR